MLNAAKDNGQTRASSACLHRKTVEKQCSGMQNNLSEWLRIALFYSAKDVLMS